MGRYTSSMTEALFIYFLHSFESYLDSQVHPERLGTMTSSRYFVVSQDIANPPTLKNGPGLKADETSMQVRARERIPSCIVMRDW